MPELSTIHETAAAARGQRDRARAALRRDILRLQAIQGEIADAERQGHDDQQGPLTRLRGEQEALGAAVKAGREAVAVGRARVIDDLGHLTLDPETLIAQLDDRVPFVLLPVRIETKFGTGANANTLLVRIFPDDIGIALHEKQLTVGEEAAGRAYWEARATANAEPLKADRERATRGAWNLVASRHGAYRASWITTATRPTNWTETSTDPGALAPPVLETKPVAWSDTPRCPVLPDRFAVVLQRGSTSRTVHGSYIPDDLPLGPDPLAAESFLTRDVTGRLQVSDDLRWLIDFDRAVAAGMGLRIPLSADEADEATGGFDRILVLGVRLSSPIAETSQALARLVESHRYSRGLSIVPQGSPTNNTDDAASGRPTTADDVDETYALEHDLTAFPLAAEPLRQTDGERLATALGLPIESVRAVAHAKDYDIAESVAIQRVLWGGTLGAFLEDMLKGIFSAADIARTRLFFNEFVHGRGTVPAFRVGAQPYGVVVTSSFADWAWHERETGDDADFWTRLQSGLAHMRDHWTSVARSTVPFVGKRGPGGTLLDPFPILLHAIGQQASSVEYASRTAVPEAYLRALAAYKNNDQTLVRNWIAVAQNQRTLELKEARIPIGPKTLRDVLFLDGTDRVDAPVVDGDPTVPLSETAHIRPYDGLLGHNYLHWLITASGADLQFERFVGADGKLVGAPAALLYKLARVAVLAELITGTKALATRLRPDVFAAAPALASSANISAPALMPAHFTIIDTARVGLTPVSQSQTIGDYLLVQARSPSALVQKPPEAAPLAAMTEALAVLAELPTARLERLFAEHVDAVSYRLDGWLTALFARRLKLLRSGRQASGSYLGAYGWVEDVRPSKTRRPVTTEQIPAELRSAIDAPGPVVTYTDNGGFVQAPSLPHAVTAAVLRNAYLTHAEPAVADRMAVNLSSARVRTALRYLEGLQNGQELAALLGYQIERGLHEGHPGVELDAIIYTLRERFPLISKKLTAAPAGATAEAIEARNVINGYDLLDFAKDKPYPYGIGKLPTGPPGSPDNTRGKAIAAEVDALRDAMDAVADVLMAEGVHQVVQGNYARARGAIQALTDGDRPPLPDVVQTQRTGTSLTHRVALFLAPGATTGWHATLTPRARANAALNHWLATVLPPPTAIQWRVTAGTAAPQFVSLYTLGLEPLDVVLMSGERLGDFSSSLERLLVDDYRETHAIGDDVFTFAFTKTDPAVPDAQALIFDPDAVPIIGHALGSLLPLLGALRRLVTASRPLGARDLMRPVEAQDAHIENPQGYDGAAAPLLDLADVKTRLEQAHASLTAEQAALSTIVTAMEPLAEDLDADETLPVQAAWTVLVTQLRPRLRRLLRYGIVEAMPTSGQTTLTRPVVLDVLTQAVAVEAIVKGKLAEARVGLDVAFTDPLPADLADADRERGRRVGVRFEAYTAAGRTLLGSDYVVLPLFAPHAEGRPELSAAAAAPAETDPLAIEAWLQSVSRVRPAMQAWDIVATCHEWLHDTVPGWVPLQLPIAPATAWIGGSFSPTKAEDLLSIVTHDLPATLAAPAMGLLVDEWTELVPAAEETSGLAMHVNRPNAVAPQAILVAVAPKQTGHWAWTDLVAILDDTLARARLRAVEPDAIGSPYFQLLPPIVSAFNNTLVLATAKWAGAGLLTKA
jgi:hypothetical protein